MLTVQAWAAAVVDLLAGEFADLSDPVVAGIAREHLQRYRAHPDPAFEFILDSPTAANWRLKAASGGGVRVADYALHRIGAPSPRAQQLTERLAALG